MSDMRRRIKRLEQLSNTGDAATISLVFSDGACVDGESMSLEQYRERFTDNDPMMTVTVGGLSADDI